MGGVCAETTWPLRAEEATPRCLQAQCLHRKGQEELSWKPIVAHAEVTVTCGDEGSVWGHPEPRDLQEHPEARGAHQAPFTSAFQSMN